MPDVEQSSVSSQCHTLITGKQYPNYQTREASETERAHVTVQDDLTTSLSTDAQLYVFGLKNVKRMDQVTLQCLLWCLKVESHDSEVVLMVLTVSWPGLT